MIVRIGQDVLLNEGEALADREILFEGRRWVRFLDRIYTSKPVHELSPVEVEALCELRLQRSDDLIDNQIYGAVANALFGVAAEVPVKPGLPALDFGCGDGRSVKYADPRLQKRLVGLDQSTNALQRNGSSLRVRASAFGQFPFADETFGIVLSLFVMHFTIPRTTLIELARVLDWDGRLCASVYGPNIEQHRLEMVSAGWCLANVVRVEAVPGHQIELWQRR